MNVTELFRSALRSLRAHKLRSFLTLLGMIISVSAIVAVVGIISGLNQYIRNELMILSPDMFSIQRFGMITSRQEFLDAIKRPVITSYEFARMRDAELPSVAEVGAATGTRVIASHGEKKLENCQVVGATSNVVNILNVKIEEAAGRWFTQAEEDAHRYVTVIGADVRDELFGQRDPIGRTILLAGFPFQVIGLMPKEGKSMLGGNRDTYAYIPFSIIRQYMGPRNSVELYIKAKSMEVLEDAKDEARTFFRAMRHTDYRAPDPFGIISQEMAMEMWKKISASIFLFIVLMSGVSLFVGGIVIMNIMLVSVAERTQEIGIRMALGARKRDILRQFLLEAAMLSVAGGIIGLSLGVCLALGVKGATGFPAQITPFIVGMALGLAGLVGVLAGFFPARRAANLVVIDAIRAE